MTAKVFSKRSTFWTGCAFSAAGLFSMVSSVWYATGGPYEMAYAHFVIAIGLFAAAAVLLISSATMSRTKMTLESN